MTADNYIGLDLEDLQVGDRFTTDRYALDEGQIIAFARQFDPQPFHLDPAAADDTFFTGLAASGWHTAAITMRLLVTSGLPIAHGLIGAGAELAWPTPTRPGDVLHVDVTIASITPSRSKADRGIVTVQAETLTVAGDVRQRLTARLLVFRRNPAPFFLPAIAEITKTSRASISAVRAT